MGLSWIMIVQVQYKSEEKSFEVSHFIRIHVFHNKRAVKNNTIISN